MVTLEQIVTYADKDFTLAECAKQLDLSKRQVQRHLKEKHSLYYKDIRKSTKPQPSPKHRVGDAPITGERGSNPHKGSISTPHSSPQPPGGSGNPSTSPLVLAKQQIQALVSDGNFQAAKYIIENPHRFSSHSSVPAYRRPECFTPKQHKLVDAILNDNIKVVICEGVQRAGKSTAVMIATIEHNLRTPDVSKQYDLMAGKGDQAERILRDLMNDPIIKDITLVHIPAATNEVGHYWNGTRLDTHETTVADIKGGDSVLVWIDEFDVAMKKDPNAILTAFYTMRAVKNMKIILTANMDTGAYMMFRDTMMKEGEINPEVAFITMSKEDAPHVTAAGNDELLYTVSTAIGGKSLAQRRLDGIHDGTGDQFDQQDLSDAYDLYETIYETLFRTETPWLETDFNVLSIDPSNMGHPFGWMVGGVRENILVEFDSGEFKMGLSPTGDRWSPDKVNMFFYQICKKYKVKAVALENNTYGGALGLYLEARKIKVYWVTHGKDGNSNSLSNFLSIARAVFARHAIILKNLEAKPELTLYDPIEKGKSNTQFKGDLADAIVNLIWVCAHGMKYLKTEKFQCIVNQGAVR